MSDFFRQNANGDLDKGEASLSAATTLSAVLNPNWMASIGIGSATRTADASERYSDRFPASKAQMPAEFMGNPELDPERNTQIDLWLEGNYRWGTVQFNGFARRIGNYITISPTILPKRLPLSPTTVFRYVNGSADFWGLEASLDAILVQSLTFRAGAAHLRGRDKSQNEPALGVAPLKVNVGLRYEQAESQIFVEGRLHATAQQKRVAASRGEEPTEGHATIDLKAGARLWSGMKLQFGVINLMNKEYTNHLNAKNPFTRQRVSEPGRVLFLNLNYAL